MSKEVNRGNQRGHRRATSCYDFDFLSNASDSTTLPQKDSPKESLRIPIDQQKLDYFEYFKFSRPSSESEKSVLVDCLDDDRDEKARKELGLKFTASLRMINENGDQDDQVVCESPKNTKKQRIIAKIQVKYGTDLGRIDEDAHEASLANSRNSIAFKHSAQKTLAKIVRGSGSGRKDFGEIYEIEENKLILEEFDLSREEKENKEPNSNFIEKKTNKAIIVQQKNNFINRDNNQQQLSVKIKPKENPKPMPVENVLGVGGFFLPLGFQAPNTSKNQFTDKNNHSSSSNILEKTGRLKKDTSTRNYMTLTLQRLHKERGRSQKSISDLSRGDSKDSKKSRTPTQSRVKLDDPFQFDFKSPVVSLRPKTTQSIYDKLKLNGTGRRGNSINIPSNQTDLKRALVHNLLKKSSSNTMKVNPNTLKSASERNKVLDNGQENGISILLAKQNELLIQLSSRLELLKGENSLVANMQARLLRDNRRIKIEMDMALSLEKGYQEQLDILNRRLGGCILAR